MMTKHRVFHENLRKTYGHKSYPVFNQMMMAMLHKVVQLEKTIERLIEEKKKSQQSKSPRSIKLKNREIERSMFDTFEGKRT